MILLYTLVSLVIAGIILSCFRSRFDKGIIPVVCLAFLLSMVICTVVGCVWFFKTPLETNVNDKFYVMLDSVFTPEEDYLFKTTNGEYRPSDYVKKTKIDSIMIGDRTGIKIHKIEKENNSLGLLITPSYEVENKTILVLTEKDYETFKSFLE